jgi:hypothetical protein
MNSGVVDEEERGMTPRRCCCREISPHHATKMMELLSVDMGLPYFLPVLQSGGSSSAATHPARNSDAQRLDGTSSPARGSISCRKLSSDKQQARQLVLLPIRLQSWLNLQEWQTADGSEACTRLPLCARHCSGKISSALEVDNVTSCVHVDCPLLFSGRSILGRAVCSLASIETLVWLLEKVLGEFDLHYSLLLIL